MLDPNVATKLMADHGAEIARLRAENERLRDEVGKAGDDFWRVVGEHNALVEERDTLRERVAELERENARLMERLTVCIKANNRARGK
jgi:predicted nuclease with TOPRIM domain